MGWLHRLLDHRNEMLTQLRQIDLIAQDRTEGRHRASSIILAPVEATVNDPLNTMA